jgi:hypothetical protein
MVGKNDRVETSEKNGRPFKEPKRKKVRLRELSRPRRRVWKDKRK